MLPREKCSHIKGIKIPKLFLILLPPNVFNLPSIPYTSELSQMTEKESMGNPGSDSSGHKSIFILDIWCYSVCIWYLVIQRCNFSFYLGSVLFSIKAALCHDADVFLCFKVLVFFSPSGGKPIQGTIWWREFCNIVWECYETALFTLPVKHSQYCL